MKGILIAVGAVLVIALVWFLFAWSDNSMDDMNQDDDQASMTDDNTNEDSNTGDSTNNSPFVLLEENEAGDSVAVASASLQEDGFIVLYRTDSTTGEVEQIAVSGLLEAGVYADEPVFEGVTVDANDSVAAVVYVDNGDGVFSTDDDIFALDASGSMVNDVDVIAVPPSEEAAELLDQAEEVLERELEVESETEASA